MFPGIRTRIRYPLGTLANNSESHYHYVLGGQIESQTRFPLYGPYEMGIDQCVDETHPGPPYRSGGPCDIWHKKVGPYHFDSFTADQGWWGSARFIHYSGNWKSELPMRLNDPSGWLSSWGDGSAYGATGWNKYKPGKPGAQLSVFLGELRDLPRMFQFKLREFRDIGSQYLNYRFGWKPFLNDLRRFFNTTKDFAKRYDALRRNNGQWVKKGGVVASSNDSWEETVGFGVGPVLPTQFYPLGYSLPPMRLKWTQSKKVWFEGRFKYWIPDLGTQDFLDRFRRTDLGLTLSPEVVWELIPFSWLIDWFTNIGDVMSNASDGNASPVVAQYAYVMCHSRLRVDISNDFQYYPDVDAGGLKQVSIRTYVEWERKQRAAANPFGFGLTYEGLSAGQLAILVALGLARGWI